MTFSTLEKTILQSKGVSPEQLAVLENAGVQSKTDFATIGDAQTLADISQLPPEVCQAVMNWACGVQEPQVVPTSGVVIDSADVVKCVHCQAKQPKDYSPGDLCFACGKQVEPTSVCYWCGSEGPGQFCRSCSSEYVVAADLPIAMLLKREGVQRDQIAYRIQSMDDAEKAVLWGRIR